VSEEETKVLVVVGRSETDLTFHKRIDPYLYDSYEIKGVYALGEPTDLNDSERFVCFITGNEVGNWTAESQKIRIVRRKDKDAGDPLRCTIHDSMDEALTFVRDEYDFPIADLITAFRDRSQIVANKFGYATADETEEFQVMMALASTGVLALTRGLLSGSQVPVVVLLSHGADRTIVRPVAILINEAIKEVLELPTTDGMEDE
jgi:hypothetical protein